MSLNVEFAKLLQLEIPFKQRDLEVGKCYGVISVTSLLPNNPLSPSSQTLTPRGAFDDRAFTLSLIVSTLIPKRINAEATKIMLLTDIDSAVSQLQQTVSAENSWAYALEINGEISAEIEQSTKSPNPWRINVGCDLLLPVRFYRASIYGEHAAPPDVAQRAIQGN